MAVSLRSGLCASGPYEVGLEKKERLASFDSHVVPWRNEFKGRQVVLSEHSGSDEWYPRSNSQPSIHAQASICVPRSLRWWEKISKPNMIEIQSAQELVDSLLDAGDKLVIVDFYSPGCGGCKALHPKVCQLAESNPNAIFLKVNYEELRSMCQSLHIHVLPFFQFYRGAQGRLCGFSCTNATIHKFKAALAKHGTDRCSIGPARGLEESELQNLALNRDIHFNYSSRSSRMHGLALAAGMSCNTFSTLAGLADVEDGSVAMAMASMP